MHLLAAVILCFIPFHVLPSQATLVDPSILGMPSGPWPLVRNGRNGPETFLIPDRIKEIRRLSEPERSELLKVIREHEANLSFLRKTTSAFVGRINSQRFRASPEYALDAGRVLMAVDFENAGDDNPLRAHEPVLQALPSYARVVLLAPKLALSKVRARIQALGLGTKVRIVVTHDRSRMSASRHGVTRWIRDVLLTTREGPQTVLLASLAHRDYVDVSHNDLAYLARISKPEHQVLRMPIFLRGGNLAVARAGRTVLFIGSEELKMNQQWFVETFAFSPPPGAIAKILRAATGADEVAVLPNSRNLYHLDMYVVPIRDGAVGLLSPVVPSAVDPVDGEVLSKARASLERLGFQVVPIPTTAERIRSFQSPVNIVPFTDRTTGARRALVPVFPEPEGNGARNSLNAKVLAAYRAAGLEPVPVVDWFHLRGGNLHCAVVPLQ